MSTSAATFAEAPPAVSENTRSLLETGIRRTKLLPKMVGEIGLYNTVRMAIDVLSPGPRRETPIRVKNSLFREPLTMSTALADVGTLLEISRRQVYKLPESLAERVNGTSIIDFGAHIGLAAVYFANRFPDSPITSFEPNPRNYEYLIQNAQPYSGQIDTINAALAPQPGMVGSHLLEGAHPSNHVARIYQGYSSDIEQRVAAVSPAEVASITNDTVGLLKVDIEGAEKDLFDSGSMDTLLGLTQVMMIETHDQYQPGSSQVVDSAAKQAGLELYSFDGHTTIYSRS